MHMDYTAFVGQIHVAAASIVFGFAIGWIVGYYGHRNVSSQMALASITLAALSLYPIRDIVNALLWFFSLVASGFAAGDGLGAWYSDYKQTVAQLEQEIEAVRTTIQQISVFLIKAQPYTKQSEKEHT
jgi:hypothetical protein